MGKNIFVFLLAVLFYAWALCQEPVQDVNSYLSNQVYKNIAAFNIRYCSFAFNHIDVDKYFWSNSDFFYNYFMADYGFKMEMKIKKINLVYPNERFQLYEILTNGFTFLADSGNIARGSIGPISTDIYLLALNETNGDIKFISGQYFKSAISQDFKINTNEPNSLILYITMRAYVIKPQNIAFVKKRHRALIYTAFSEIYNKKVVIKLPIKNIENIVILPK
jgi:hypothetical protein